MRWLQLCGSLNILWHCPSLGLEWKLTFSSPVPTAEFSKCVGNSLTFVCLFVLFCFVLFLRIWNSSAGIPSPPWILFMVMVPKAHLTSHSSISGPSWVTTPSWLSRPLRYFLYHSVYSCYLLIFYASVRPILFLSFVVPIFEWNITLVSLIYFKRSQVFPILLLSSISLHCSLKKAFLSRLPILWNSALNSVYLCLSLLHFTSLFSAICHTSSYNNFAFLHFFFLKMVLVTASCSILWTSAYSYSGTPSDLIPWNLFVYVFLMWLLLLEVWGALHAPLACNVFFHPLIFSLYVSLRLRWVSGR